VISIAGRNIVEAPLSAKSKLGFLPDNPDIYERLTGLEYIRFIADVYGVPEKERVARAKHLLNLFEMTQAAPDLIASYSHGMRQKIALTAALVHKPELLILDEPMVGLDPRAAAIMKRLMRDHCNDGGTVFFSTHVLDVAERLCDRVGIINKGSLVAQGTLEDLRKGQGENATLEALFLELTEARLEE
jgi:ABC-2 type transport system ATP-binding protein